jgi:hypothetical protein
VTIRYEVYGTSNGRKAKVVQVWQPGVTQPVHESHALTGWQAVTGMQP